MTKRTSCTGARARLLCSTVIAGMAAFGTAQAQTPAPAAPAGPATVSEVIVTAQRREERLQDVPIAITAFTAERLQQQNISQSQDLQATVPSLVVGANGQGSRDSQTFTLRGQGATFQASPGVVVYMSEVPLPAPITLSQQGGPGNYVDLENLQVLAGPQGTLFGRNTTGGAILLVPRKPQNEFGGYIQGGLGNYDAQELEAVLNVPIIEGKLLMRVVGAYRDREGYTHDYQWNKDRDDTHWYSGRLTLSWKPTDRLSNDFLLYGATSETNGTGLIHRGFNIPALQGVGFCVDPPLTPPGPSGIAVNCSVYRDVTADADRLGPRGTRNSVDAFQTTETWGVINTTNYELNDNLTLRNIVSYQRFSSSYAYDGDGSLIQQYEVDPIRLPPGYLNESPVHLPRDDLRGVTEELQLQGSYFEDKLVFAAGGFYYNQEPDGLQGASQISYCPAAFTGFCPPQQSYGGVSNKSTALYAQATVDLGLATQALDGVRLTGGYRYTWDEIDGTSLAFTPQAGGTVICTNTNLVTVNPEECRFSGHLESKAPTWTFGLDYRIRPELLVFGKVSRGYKAGGFNPYAVRPETRTFNPEKVTSYEIGFKSDFRIADMPTRLNASVYKLDYTNIQRATGDFNPVTSASGAQILAAEATIKGLELDATIRPFDWLEIGGNYSRTDGEYDKFNYTALVPTVACNGPVAAGGIADASCVPMQYVAPEIWSIHASVDLPIPEDMGTLSFFVNYSQTADQHTEALVLEQFQPGERIESFGLLNASLDWKGIAGSNVDLSLFVSNATDETYRISNTDVFQSGSLLSWATIYGEPRMYGVRLRYNFGS